MLVLQAAPAAVLLLLFPVPAPHELDGPAWTWDSKPAILPSPFLFATALGGRDAGLAVFLLCAGLIAWLTWAGALRWTRLLAAPAAVLAALALLAPFRLHGVTFIDQRFPVAAACLAFAALSAVPGRGRQLAFAASALAVGLAGANRVRRGDHACVRHSVWRAAGGAGRPPARSGADAGA